MFARTIRHNSQSLPGVSFETHRMGLAKRVEVDGKTLAIRQRMAEIRAEYPPHSEKELDLIDQIQLAARKADAVDDAEVPAALAEIRRIEADFRAAASPETRQKRAALDAEWAQLDSLARLEWIRAGLVSIDGGEFSGASVEDVLEFAPVDLMAEIYRAIAGDGQLSPDAAKNSPSPSISRPAEATSTTAADASSNESTSSATA